MWVGGSVPPAVPEEQQSLPCWGAGTTRTLPPSWIWIEALVTLSLVSKARSGEAAGHPPSNLFSGFSKVDSLAVIL